MGSGETGRADPHDGTAGLAEAFQSILSNNSPPTSVAFLDLGCAICDAGLYYVAKDDLPKKTLPESYAANLLHTAARYHELAEDAEAHARVNDHLHLETMLTDIIENGRWKYVRSELANCATIILEADRKRQEQLKTFLRPLAHPRYRPSTEDGRWWADATAPPSPCPTCGSPLTGDEFQGWLCRTCNVLAEPNPIRRAEAELVRWAQIEVVGGKFCNGWAGHLERCEHGGMPAGEPNSWLGIILDYWGLVQPGKPLLEDHVNRYLHRAHDLTPAQVAALTLEEFAATLKADANPLTLHQPTPKTEREPTAPVTPVRDAEAIGSKDASLIQPTENVREYYVTLDQAAALVNRDKRTLERKKQRMPKPQVKGGGGKPAEWSWSVIRPWLEHEFGRSLPEIPPHAVGK